MNRVAALLVLMLLAGCAPDYTDWANDDSRNIAKACVENRMNPENCQKRCMDALADKAFCKKVRFETNLRYRRTA